ncbi:N-alpha-acetyltransferase 40 [Galdieria sulphuraria]|nr:N-alpha-acetyltransferase 40 [Galdieria sulphuraria]
MNSLRNVRKRQRRVDAEEDLSFSRSRARSLVLEANGIENPLEKFELDKTIQLDQFEITLDSYKGSQLSLELRQWCFQVVEKHTRQDYESAGLWSAAGKKAELRSDAARYLLVRHYPPMTLVGFVHYRFTIENLENVLYIYELHVVDRYQGLGVGKKVVQILETLGRHTKMRKMMLTVFKRNEDAVRFYKEKLGFSMDASSPQLYGDMECKYEILSKDLMSFPEDCVDKNSVMRASHF